MIFETNFSMIEKEIENIWTEKIKNDFHCEKLQKRMERIPPYDLLP